MNLPALYAAVCAKRPDLAVEGLRRLVGYWYRGSMCEVENTAAALILARWEDGLPEGVNVLRERNGHRVWKHDQLKEWFAKERLEALAAFWLEETT